MWCDVINEITKCNTALNNSSKYIYCICKCVYHTCLPFIVVFPLLHFNYRQSLVLPIASWKGFNKKCIPCVWQERVKKAFLYSLVSFIHTAMFGVKLIIHFESQEYVTIIQSPKCSVVIAESHNTASLCVPDSLDSDSKAKWHSC